MHNCCGAQSAVVAHWTHASFEQMGVGTAQLPSTRHSTQAPVGSQYSPEGHWLSTAHSTHFAVVVLQVGAEAPVHCAFDVQPSTHTNMPGSQMGFAAPQSELPRHCTHVLLAG